MAYSSEHMLLQWGGVFAAAPGAAAFDEFAGTMRFAGPGVNAVDTDEVGEALGDALATWWSSTGAQIPTVAQLGWVKWNKIGTDGRYVARNQTRLYSFDEFVRGGQSSRYPLQVCWCATWTTDFGRGRASKGRTYFPTAVEVSSSTTCRVPADVAQAWAVTCRGLLTSLNLAARSNGSVVVASVMSDLDEGVTTPIRGVRVGNRLDIQRRRDNSVAEEYFSSTAV